MIQSARRIAPMLLLAAVSATPVRGSDNPGSTQPTDKYATLVRQLGDVDPAVRKAAYNSLSGSLDAARPALREAMHSNRPAVVAAATELMLKAPWSTSDDPLFVRAMLLNYGKLQPPERAQVLTQLCHSTDIAAHRAALRVSMAEPAESVVWQALANENLNDAWQPLLNAANGPIPSAVLIARARGIGDVANHRPGDAVPKEAVDLLEKAFAQERDHPTGTAADLSWAVNTLVDTDLAEHRPAVAADRLRLLIGRGDAEAADASTDAEDLRTASTTSAILQRLLDLQARFGPLPGLDRDLLAAGDTAPDKVALTIAVLAARLGDPLSSHLMIQAAAKDLPDESDHDRAERLFRLGDSLLRAGMNDAAQTVLDRCVAIDVPGLDKITNAYLRLCDIHSAAGEEQLAGDCLQRALDHLGPGETLSVKRPGGEYEAWPREDVQGKIAWLYLVAARKAKDTDRVKQQALAVMESGTTDGEVFLDTLPTLEDPSLHITDKATIDAYFDRVYGKAVDRMNKHPNDPLWMNDLAWTCARSGRHLDEALKLATAAVAAKPNEAAFLDTLAEAKFRTGSPAEALALEEKAVKLDPDLPFMREQIERFKKAAATQPAK